ncbi:MAG: hypothetical protein Q9166_003789 [cf. Caloplaca sp. 2 TL-2023]
MPVKRKQTPDMPQSPPKRVTRARAKKAVDSKPETTRITTASAKASVNKKTAAGPSKRSTKTAPQLDEDMKDEPEEDVKQEQPTAEAPKTRGRAKANSTQPAVAPAKPTRSRSNKATTATHQVEQLPKPKGRQKRNAEVEAPNVAETVAEDVAELIQPAPPARATRGRPAASAATEPATKRIRAAAAAPKKRVKFDDHAGQDKENEPIAFEGQKKPGANATGLRAKPIRKPASVKGSTRVVEPAQKDSQANDSASKPDVLPLSPKKVTQVAKTPSVGSEDELAGEKTPLRPMNQSPSKLPMNIKGDADITVARLELAPTDATQSPTKGTSPARFATSPRKPPPSPFKDALKDSPRKVDLAGRVAPPKFDAPSSPSKSPLKESAKRVNLGGSAMKPILQWSKTPMKSSLMKSPARRPGGSAIKSGSLFSPTKATAAVPTVEAATASKEVNTLKLPSLSMENAASSPLRAAQSPGQHSGVHDATKESKLELQASASSPNPTKEPEAAALDEAPESETVDILFEPVDSNHLGANEVCSSKSPEMHVPQEEGPALNDFDDHSDLEGKSCANKQFEDEPHQDDNATTEIDNIPTPMAPPTYAARPAFVLASPMIQGRVEDSESEDELASPQKQASPSPLKNFGISAQDFGTPGVVAVTGVNKPTGQVHRASLRNKKRDSTAMTPLAMQMSSWLASSPEKTANVQTGYKRGIFSPAKPVFPARNQSSPAALASSSPAKPSFFDEEMAIRNADDAAEDLEEGPTDELQNNCDDELVDVQASQDSQASEVYGDENAAPEDQLFCIEQQVQDHTLTCTPAKVFEHNPYEIHTVSKVPLRPSADDTPLMVPRKRSKSLTAPLSEISLTDRLSISRDSILSPILQDTNLSMSILPGDTTAPDTPETPTTGPGQTLSTPGRSIRKAGFSNVLKGAVVHVDVHTTEGADASGIFVDLLTQMGARCVKQWHWNPQASGASPQQGASPEVSTPGVKTGITHLVYKDGGKRTLEKVREAKGAVLCVGVGWVLDCEREDKWLDEANYSVDTSIVPRGGSRRRKSMEPRALANLNGSLVLAETPSKAATPEVSLTKEFMTFDTPVSRRETFEIEPQAPSTPSADANVMNHDGTVDNEYNSPLSPTTPYYLSKGARLVQQTCPPKQSQELFFPLSGRIEDQPNEAVRQRLLMARRKSLQWASKVQSPLGRTVSYGK